MLQINDPELMTLKYSQTQSSPAMGKSFWPRVLQQPILELPFRPFFLLGTLASSISLTLWVLLLNGQYNMNVSGLSPGVWHAHEMIFGFAATVAIGFILTAAQTWTKQASMSGKNLLYFCLIWLTARFAIYLNTEVSITIAVLLQALWWLMAITTFFNMVVKAKNHRNYIFIPMLISMMLLNTAVMLTDLTGYSDSALHLSRASILLFTLLMSIVAGRVIPFFTKNGAKTDTISTPKWLETLLLPVAVSGVLIFVLGFYIELPISPAVLMIITGCLHLIRLSYWKSFKTTAVPLLWSLHLSYLFMAIGLIVLGLSYFKLPLINFSIPFSSALHIITIGAIGLMIFSMMSRVSLGHTGRMLILNKALIVTFLLIIISTFIRSILPILNQPLMSWNLSALLWVAGSIVFLVVYTPILFSKRQTI